MSRTGKLALAGSAAVGLGLGLSLPLQASELGAAPSGPHTAPASPAGGRAELTAIEARLLAVHNRERARVGHPLLQWDPALAAAAASYGPTLASLGRLVHAPKELRPRQHENLAMAWHGTHTPEQLVGMWVAEKRHLKPGLFPDVSRTGYWKDIGHYSTMVWRTTTHVGCAIHEADWDYLICRYSPPGNIDGKPVLDWTPVQVAALAAP